jgi:hypothetical protein
MKTTIKMIAICIGILLCASVSAAREVKFAWDRNPEPDVTSYRLYLFNESTGGFDQVASVADDPATPANDTPITMTVPDFPEVESRVMLTAVNTAGLESLPSNEVIVKVPPGAPKGLKYSVKITAEITITPVTPNPEP